MFSSEKVNMVLFAMLTAGVMVFLQAPRFPAVTPGQGEEFEESRPFAADWPAPLKILFGLGRTICTITALATVFIAIRQRSLLYVPAPGDRPKSSRRNPWPYRHPSEHGVKCQDVAILAADEIPVHCWWLPQAQPEDAPTVIYFHANAGNLGTRMIIILDLQRICKCNVLAVEYRGFGDSTDSPSETGLIADAEAAFNWATGSAVGNVPSPKLSMERIALFGQSLGGAVAIGLTRKLAAAGKAPGALVLENTFLSTRSMAGQVFLPLRLPIVKELLRLPVVRDTWESQRRLSELAQHNLLPPVLFLSGQKDELVPAEQMAQLFAIARRGGVKAVFHKVEDGKHNDTWCVGGEDYYMAIRDLLTRVIPTPEAVQKL